MSILGFQIPHRLSVQNPLRIGFLSVSAKSTNMEKVSGIREDEVSKQQESGGKPRQGNSVQSLGIEAAYRDKLQDTPGIKIVQGDIIGEKQATLQKYKWTMNNPGGWRRKQRQHQRKGEKLSRDAVNRQKTFRHWKEHFSTLHGPQVHGEDKTNHF